MKENLLQFLKFFLVGSLNFLIDLGILFLLISASGMDKGWQYSVFKGISFFIATVNSYFLNRAWTFESKERKFNLFLLISIIGFFINVGVASLVVNSISPWFGLNSKTWAIIGAVKGSFVGLFWNFLGYKFIVFKENV
ncbi:GtrA family protein [Candidatus Parcubacteria bacterium]|nr:GtrA family protein [Patescibacteria group bacterium]MBU4466543.1 GtrA family protein [Patescibacteria group bacterium]MCG2688346.1 GtrA family protein [Candidatus Parcubacteria bacterium]